MLIYIMEIYLTETRFPEIQFNYDLVSKSIYDLQDILLL